MSYHRTWCCLCHSNQFSIRSDIVNDNKINHNACKWHNRKHPRTCLSHHKEHYSDCSENINYVIEALSNFIIEFLNIFWKSVQDPTTWSCIKEKIDWSMNNFISHSLKILVRYVYRVQKNNTKTDYTTGNIKNIHIEVGPEVVTKCIVYIIKISHPNPWVFLLKHPAPIPH